MPVTKSPRISGGRAVTPPSAGAPRRRRRTPARARPPPGRSSAPRRSGRSAVGRRPLRSAARARIRAASRSSAARVRRHHREPQPRRAVGHRRRPDRLREDALLERRLADPHREVGVADDQRHDLRLRARDVEALARELVAQRRGVVGQPLDAARLLLRAARAPPSPPPRPAGGRPVEKISGRALLTRYPRHRVVAGDERAVGAERLAERADDHVDLALEPGLGDGAAAARPERAGAVRVVDHHAHVVAPRELDDLLERRDVAVHREHAVGHDQRPAVVRVAQAPGQVVDVAVAVDERLGAREPAAVDDRRVVELVGEDDLAAARQRGHDAEVGEVAGAEQQRALRALERGEPLLEPPVQRHVARDQPRGARAGAPAHRRVGGRLAHPRVVGQPEVVVRAEQQDGLAVEDHARSLRTAHHAHAAIQAEPLELVQSVLQIQHLAPVYAAEGSPRLGAPSGLGGTEDFLR